MTTASKARKATEPTPTRSRPRRAPRPPGADQLTPLLRLARVLVAAGYLPDGVATAEQATAVMLHGAELGLPPLQALRTVHVLDGRPTLSGAALMALCVRDAGCTFRALRQDADGASVRIERPGWAPYVATFTREDAERAGLTEKRCWREYPQAMHWWRAVAQACRTVCPDVVGGWYMAEEVGGDEPPEEEGPARDEPPPLSHLADYYAGVWEGLVDDAEERSRLRDAYERFHPRLPGPDGDWDTEALVVAVRDLERHGPRVLERVRAKLARGNGTGATS